MSETSDIPLRVAAERKLAEEWALVLIAEGLSPSMQRSSEGYVLGVPAEEAERAVAILSSYERENPVEPHEGDEAAGYAHVVTALAVAGSLVVFFFVTGAGDSMVHWFQRGSADVERILRGELWRTVTALTLHADIGHVLANAIAGAVFLAAVSRALGPGLGCAVVLLAGAGGNYVNALFHGSFHVSVGASTSVFGAVGVLGGLGVVRRRRKGARGRLAWMPIVAGLALLAMLGMGGVRVDLWAHLFGFLVGGVIGVLVAFPVPRPPGLRVQWVLGGATLAVVLYCWTLAFG
ncbi:MAG: rhomboid family intramembrane serine protease [candidate division NC10 bacterium]|nr:rhomboid family intramembrane serine protease [candidate division NC10 bacterium]